MLLLGLARHMSELHTQANTRTPTDAGQATKVQINMLPGQPGHGQPFAEQSTSGGNVSAVACQRSGARPAGGVGMIPDYYLRVRICLSARAAGLRGRHKQASKQPDWLVTTHMRAHTQARQTHLRTTPCTSSCAKTWQAKAKPRRRELAPSCPGAP